MTERLAALMAEAKSIHAARTEPGGKYELCQMIGGSSDVDRRAAELLPQLVAVVEALDDLVPWISCPRTRISGGTACEMCIFCDERSQLDLAIAKAIGPESGR